MGICDLGELLQRNRIDRREFTAGPYQLATFPVYDLAYARIAKQHFGQNVIFRIWNIVLNLKQVLIF